MSGTEKIVKPLIIVFCLFLSGCAQISQPQGSDTLGSSPKWTDEERAAYEKCLEDNMAMSVAWEVIEAQCAASVAGEKDPLDAR